MATTTNYGWTTPDDTNLVKNGASDIRSIANAIDGVVYPINYLAINAQTGTTYTLVAADATKLVTLSNAAGITLTVPANSSVSFPIGTQIVLAQLGAGQVTIAGAGGVTVNSQGNKLKLNGQYALGSIIKTGTDAWLLVGNLAA